MRKVAMRVQTFIPPGVAALHAAPEALPFAARALNIPSANFRNAPSGLRIVMQPSARHFS